MFYSVWDGDVEIISAIVNSIVTFIMHQRKRLNWWQDFQHCASRWERQAKDGYQKYIFSKSFRCGWVVCGGSWISFCPKEWLLKASDSFSCISLSSSPPPNKNGLRVALIKTPVRYSSAVTPVELPHLPPRWIESGEREEITVGGNYLAFRKGYYGCALIPFFTTKNSKILDRGVTAK